MSSLYQQMQQERPESSTDATKEMPFDMQEDLL